MTRCRLPGVKENGWAGTPVLGYDVAPGGGRLFVNEEEAARVRAIYALFEEYRSARLVPQKLDAEGGHFRPGGPFALNSWRRLTDVQYTQLNPP